VDGVAVEAIGPDECAESRRYGDGSQQQSSRNATIRLGHGLNLQIKDIKTILLLTVTSIYISWRCQSEDNTAAGCPCTEQNSTRRFVPRGLGQCNADHSLRGFTGHEDRFLNKEHSWQICDGICMTLLGMFGIVLHVRPPKGGACFGKCSSDARENQVSIALVLCTCLSFKLFQFNSLATMRAKVCSYPAFL
jgi:hypothetical protein